MKASPTWLSAAILAAVAAPGLALALCLDPPGDINGDATTDVLDAQCAVLGVLWALTDGAFDEFPTCLGPSGDTTRADLNCDGQVTVADINAVILMAIGAPAPTFEACGCEEQPPSCVCAPLALAHWTFETSIPTTAGPHAAEQGWYAAQSLALGVKAGATTWSNPAGNGSAESFSANNWAAGDYFGFVAPTLGAQTIRLRWDQTRSNTGPADFEVQWSLDGLIYSTLGFYSLGAISWATGSKASASVYGPIDLPAQAANQNQVWFRLVSLVAAASAGTSRIDDVILEGVGIEELQGPGCVCE